jgi:hypothetical protein
MKDLQILHTNLKSLLNETHATYNLLLKESTSSAEDLQASKDQMDKIGNQISKVGIAWFENDIMMDEFQRQAALNSGFLAINDVDAQNWFEIFKRANIRLTTRIM